MHVHDLDENAVGLMGKFADDKKIGRVEDGEEDYRMTQQDYR